MKYIKLFARSYTLQYVESYVRAIGPEYKKYTPYPVKGIVVLPDNGNLVTYAPETQWKKYEGALERIARSELSFKKFIQAFHGTGQLYVGLAKQLSYLDYSKAANTEILKDYRRYIFAQEKYNAYLWAGNFMADYVGRRGEEMVSGKNIGENSKAEIIEELFQPRVKCGVLLLQSKLIRFKQKGITRLPAGILAKLTKEFGYLSCLDLHNQPWGPKDFISYYKDLSVPKNRSDLKNIFAKLEFSHGEKQLLTQVREMVYVKDVRDVYRRQGIFFAQSFFREIGRRMKLSLKEVGFYSHAEIEDFLSKGKRPERDEIIKRQEGFLFCGPTTRPKISTNPALIAKYLKQVHDKQEQNSTLFGIVASGGRARGRVKIVYNVQDLHKVKTGDILVAVTTHPDFVPAMQKASAIVTDEGGLTSHAAIVSREMKKPCIVGTKIATQVLKDGDLVEVDANKGKVRKI